jgi:hypothetical protein
MGSLLSISKDFELSRLHAKTRATGCVTSFTVWHLNGCGPIGRQMTRNTASLGEMFSVSWLRETFPSEDDLPPPKSYLGREASRRRTPRRAGPPTALKSERPLTDLLQIALPQATEAEVDKFNPSTIQRERLPTGQRESTFPTVSTKNIFQAAVTRMKQSRSRPKGQRL